MVSIPPSKVKLVQLLHYPRQSSPQRTQVPTLDQSDDSPKATKLHRVSPQRCCQMYNLDERRKVKADTPAARQLLHGCTNNSFTLPTSFKAVVPASSRARHEKKLVIRVEQREMATKPSRPSLSLEISSPSSRPSSPPLPFSKLQSSFPSDPRPPINNPLLLQQPYVCRGCCDYEHYVTCEKCRKSPIYSTAFNLKTVLLTRVQVTFIEDDGLPEPGKLAPWTAPLSIETLMGNLRKALRITNTIGIDLKGHRVVVRQ
jgi:hypothetical protein